MKNTISIIALLTLSVFAFAQKKLILHYSYTQNISGREVTNFIDQYYHNGRSIEVPIVRQKLNDTTIRQGRNVTRHVYLTGLSKRLPFVLKNPASKSLIYAENIWIKPTMLVIDSINNFKWNILKENKVIGEATCVKAETFFRGRNYIAWFKPDFDIQTGPWKFTGLPGIIYEIMDQGKLFSYSLNDLEFVDEFPLELKVPDVYVDDQMITHSDFILAWKTIKLDAEKDNDQVNYTFTGSSHIKRSIAPMKELY